jgi:carbamoyltransferase
MRVLGISEGFHDASASLVEVSPYTDKVKIHFAAQAERYTGRKNDPWLPPKLRYTRADVSVFHESIKLKNQRRKFHSMSPVEYVDVCSHHLNHHQSHAAAAYYTAPFDDNTVIVVIDAIGEWACSSIWIPKEYGLECVWEERYPHSIGLFYSAITKRLGLKPNEDEYITMGMAAFGEPIVSMRWCFDLPDRNWHRGFGVFDFQGYAPEDIAASAQFEVENRINAIMAKASEYGSNICYGGGVALNCVANSKILPRHFDKIWVFPNPGDGGNSLGAALGYLCRKVEFKDCFWGYDIVRSVSPKTIVNSLIANKVVGIANGRAEFGPRALGNRSLLGDPRYNIKRKVNKIKRRQKFRPFAPAILEEFADEYFEGPKNEYMQYVSKAKHGCKAVTHVDGTARVQVVKKDSRSILRPILEEWYNRTKCPMLLNTSLNIKGSPMVNTERDALSFENKYGVKVF